MVTCQVVPRIVCAAAAIFGAALSASSPALAGSYTFTNVADSGGVYRDFNPPAISDSGGVAYRATRDDLTGVVIVSSVGGLIDSATTPYAGIGLLPAVSNTRLLFVASLDAGNNGVFTGANPATSTVATSAGLPFASFNYPTVNNAGTVAFYAVRDLIGEGIFTGPNDPADAIVTSDGPFFTFRAPKLNDTGGIVFWAFRDVGGSGIYRGPDIVTDLVADTDGAYSGFGTTSAATINDAGTVAFFASLDAGGSGIFTGADPLTGAVATTAGPYASFGEAPGIDAAGNVVFLATLDAGGTGLFTGANPLTDKVIATGDVLFGSTVTGLDFYRGVNDGGTIAFKYVLADGRDGVAVAVVPEPASLSILALGCVLAMRRLRAGRGERHERGRESIGSKAGVHRLRTLLFASLISALYAHPALATDFHWNVAGPANWNVGANWNPAGPPSGGGGDHAFINNGGTALITAGIPDIQDIFVGSGAGTSGTLNQSGGTIHGGAGATNGWTFIGNNGGTGTYNLSGGTSDNERLFIGRLGGTGTASISGTGKVEWVTNPGVGEFVVGLDAGSTGTAIMSGTATVYTGFVLFGAAGATGNLMMSDDSSITSGGNSEFHNAQVTITGNATVYAGNDLWVGQGTGRSTTVNQNSGVVEAETLIAIGREGSTAVYNLSGTATLRKLAVGTPDSDGSFIAVGTFGTGGSGTLNVQGNATVWSNTGMILNETAGQAGTVNQSGGTVTLHDFTPQSFQSHLGQSLNIDPSGHGQGVYRLSGGTLNAETVLLGDGVFEMTGGTFRTTNFVGNLTQGGGTLSPSDSLGFMQIMGDYSLTSGNLLIELDGLTAVTEYQQLLVTGVVTLAGDLTLDVGFAPTLGDAFTIIDNRGAGAVSGTFSQGSSITADGITFAINYGGGDGNDVVLTVVPEPAGLALLALAGLASARRRR